MYKFLGLRFYRWAWLLSPLSFLFRIRIYPEVNVEQYFQNYPDKTFIYVLPRMSILDIMVMNKALKKLKKTPVKEKATPNGFLRSALLVLKGSRFSLFSQEKNTDFEFDLNGICTQDKRVKSHKLVLMPISIFWSRAAERDEQGFLFRSLFPDDGTGNGLQKLWMLFLHRGEVNVCVSKGLVLEPPALDNCHDYALRIKRLISIEFAKERTAAFGPTLYEKEKITQWILSTEASKNLIKNSDNPLKIKKQIVSYINEMSANYNYLTVRAGEKLLDLLWNKVFSGVRIRNFENIERYAKDGQIIWMPSHRSYFDFLLLSYVLFRKGLVTPHVAAGINLNFWPIGSILRQGGAFFLRRSFSGNRVYAHTFAEYVNFLLQNSFPIEFFPEGGRSRIGKLLPPKLGMLSICTQSIISRKAENTYFIPVYFGYDKVMEDESYARELKGRKKQTENAWQFLNGIRKVFNNYGSVDVSFGEPLRFGDIWFDYFQKLKRENPGVEHVENLFPALLKDFKTSDDGRDPRVNGFVKYLGQRINQRINGAATASTTAILCTSLLAHFQEPISSLELKKQCLLLHYLANEFGLAVNWHVSTNYEALELKDHLITGLDEEPTKEMILPETLESIAEQYFRMGEKWNFMSRTTSTTGISQVSYSKSVQNEFSLWWYRGTSFHIFAAFGFLAFLLRKADFSVPLSMSAITSQMVLLRQLWREELFWDSNTPSAVIVSGCLKIFSSLGFVRIDGDSVYVIAKGYKHDVLSFLVRVVSPERDMYGIQLAVAMDLWQKKGWFSKDEILAQSVQWQGRAYSRKIAKQSAFFAKVFGARVFDAFYRHKVFVLGENYRFTLDTTQVNSFLDFLKVSEFAALSEG